MNIIPSKAIIEDGISAQSLSMALSAANIANAHTTKTDQGGPYQRQVLAFESYMPNRGSYGGSHAPSVRTKVNVDQTPGLRVYQPQHPHADASGMLELPNVKILQEKVNLMSASKTYEALATCFGQGVKLVQNLLNMLR